MGGANSKVSAAEISQFADKHHYSRKKISTVWDEFVNAKFGGRKPDKNVKPSELRLTFEDFVKFAELYRVGLGGNRDGLRPLYDALDTDGDGLLSFEELLVSAILVDKGSTRDKLEFLFNAYSSNGESLDVETQLRPIVSQLASTARAMGRDEADIEPELHQLLKRLDVNGDGKITREEWLQQGLDAVPLLVLFGINKTFRMYEGTHSWTYVKAPRTKLCMVAACDNEIKGACFKCEVCGGFAHLDCAPGPQACARGQDPCRRTCVATDAEAAASQRHFWVKGYFKAKCPCGSSTKGRRAYACAWCKRAVHDECRDKYVGGHEDCDLGELRRLILPSTSFRVSQLDGEAAYADIARPIHIAPPPGSLPLVVFLNSGSGGQQGVGLHRKFSYMLNPRQVFDLQSQPPAIALNQYKDVPGLVVLCCGGDGTVGWLLSELDNIDFGGRPVPPVAILPLGTGNDLARCFGWGGGYTGEHLVPILRSIETAPVDLLDRWAITIEPLTGAGAGAEAGDEAPLSIINNYFSIGVDAAVAHKFHVMRERYPEKFKSRARNKVWYAELGAGELLKRSCEGLHKSATLECDGQPFPLAEGPALEGLALINIMTMYGGQEVWKADSKFPGQRMDDRQIEIAGLLGSVHVAAISAGLGRHGHRLAQCRECVITTSTALPMQIDGEPWIQAPCRIVIRHHNQARVLHPRDIRADADAAAAAKRTDEFIQTQSQSIDDLGDTADTEQPYE